MRLVNDALRFFTHREVSVVFIYLLGMAAVPGVSYVAAVHLMLLAFIKKREWFFKSLVYFSLLKHFNPVFHPPSTNLFLLFVLILAVWFVIKMLMSSKLHLFALEKKFYILLLLFFVTSMIGSLFPGLSLIRIVIVWVFIFVVFQSIRRIGTMDILTFMIRLAIMMTVASFPLVFTSVGYLQPVGFFKGVINHSQDFALVLLPLFMVYVMSVLSGKIKYSLFHVFVLILGISELILSASRAAVGAVVVSLALYVLFQKRKKVKQVTLVVFSFLMVALLLVVAQNPEKIESKIEDFFIKYKTGRVVSVEDSLKGRLYLVQVAKENLMKYPLTGIGFNVQTYYQDPKVRQALPKLIKYIPGTDIMYSRPLEKGNLYMAVFEENGIIAGAYFAYLLFYMLWLFYRSGLSYTWVPFVAMTFNFMGEASLFSPSGPGNFQMLMIAAFYVMALQQNIERKRKDV